MVHKSIKLEKRSVTCLVLIREHAAAAATAFLFFSFIPNIYMLPDNAGNRGGGLEFVVPIFSFFIFSTLLY